MFVKCKINGVGWSSNVYSELQAIQNTIWANLTKQFRRVLAWHSVETQEFYSYLKNISWKELAVELKCGKAVIVTIFFQRYVVFFIVRGNFAIFHTVIGWLAKRRHGWICTFSENCRLQSICISCIKSNFGNM